MEQSLFMSVGLLILLFGGKRRIRHHFLTLKGTAAAALTYSSALLRRPS